MTAIFAGFGVTGPDIDDFDNTAYGYGAGLRYLVSEADRMNVGFDVATDNDELAVYFRVGEAF